MDALDVAILRTMGIDPWGRDPKDPALLKAGRIAKELGVTPERVRDRIARLEKAGVIRGYQLVPNFRLFGMHSSCYYLRFRDEARIPEVASQLDNLDRMAGVWFYVGPVVCVDVTYRTPPELERVLRVLTALAGESEFYKFYDLEMPMLRRPLSNLDWRILKALRGRAMRPLREVASEIGVSTKTVQRRFDRMAKDGAFFIVPRLDWRKVPDAFLFAFLVEYAPESTTGTERALRKVLEPALVGAYCPTTPQLGHYAAMLFATSLEQVDAYREAAARVKGVRRVEVMIARGGKAAFSWVDDAIEARIAETAATPFAPPRGDRRSGAGSAARRTAQ